VLGHNAFSVLPDNGDKRLLSAVKINDMKPRIGQEGKPEKSGPYPTRPAQKKQAPAGGKKALRPGAGFFAPEPFCGSSQSPGPIAESTPQTNKPPPPRHMRKIVDHSFLQGLYGKTS